MYLTKVLIRFQHDLFTIHIPFTTMQIFDAGIPHPPTRAKPTQQSTSPLNQHNSTNTTKNTMVLVMK